MSARSAGERASTEGEITGTAYDSKSKFHAYLRHTNGAISVFDAPDAYNHRDFGTFGQAIDDKGDVAGVYTVESQGSRVAMPYVRAADGTITEFFGAADTYGASASGVARVGGKILVVGTAYGPDTAAYGYIYKSNGAVTVFGGKRGNDNTEGLLINSSGVVAGSFLNSDGRWIGYLRYP